MEDGGATFTWKLKAGWLKRYNSWLWLKKKVLEVHWGPPPTRGFTGGLWEVHTGRIGINRKSTRHLLENYRRSTGVDLGSTRGLLEVFCSLFQLSLGEHKAKPWTTEEVIERSLGINNHSLTEACDNWTTCITSMLDCGRKWRFWRTRQWGEHANTTQRDSRPGIELTTFWL